MAGFLEKFAFKIQRMPIRLNIRRNIRHNIFVYRELIYLSITGYSRSTFTFLASTDITSAGKTLFCAKPFFGKSVFPFAEKKPLKSRFSWHEPIDLTTLPLCKKIHKVQERGFWKWVLRTQQYHAYLDIRVLSRCFTGFSQNIFI